jgi:hypothetical protein
MQRTISRALLAPVLVAASISLAIPGRASAAVPVIGLPVLPVKLRPKREYTYRVENLPSHRPAAATDAAVYASIDRSFRQWEAFTAGSLGITFRAIDALAAERADITITFRAFSTSPDDDANSGVDCAHTCRDGDPAHIWLNDARTWTPTELGGNGRGALELLMLHEVGHLLGLPHYRATKCEPLTVPEATRDADCLGTGAVMTRFLSVTPPGPFVMPIRCTDLAALEAVYGVSMQSRGCADRLIVAPGGAVATSAGAHGMPLPRVQVVDSLGRPVQNVVVAFTVTAGDASGLIQVTDSSGVAALGGWVVPGTGTASAIATVPGLETRLVFIVPARGETATVAAGPCASCARDAGVAVPADSGSARRIPAPHH